MVVSHCTTFTLPEKVASFFLSRISSEAASIWIGWSRTLHGVGNVLHRILRGGPVGGINGEGKDHRLRGTRDATVEIAGPGYDFGLPIRY
jgi:hypothetical protein